MPDSMNFGNPSQPMGYGDPMDPMAYGQPQDPAYAQYAQQMQNAYQNGMYQQDPYAQAAGMQQYPDMASQIYGSQQASMQPDMYYQNAMGQTPYGVVQEDPNRMARQQQIRATSIFGPKDIGGGMNEAAMPGASAMGAQAGYMQSGMGSAFGQPAQPAAPTYEAPSPSFEQQIPQVSQAPEPSIPAAIAAAAPEPAASSKPVAPPKGKGSIALVFGFLSIIFALIPPLGIVFGILARKKSKPFIDAGIFGTAADTGRIFGTVGLIFSIVMCVVMLVLGSYMYGGLYGVYNARSMAIFFNDSPLGNFFWIYLPPLQ